MSDALVKFYSSLTADRECAPGQEQCFVFVCPKYNRRCGRLLIAGKSDVPRDGQNQNGGKAQWDWDGDRARPTFSPSINCSSCWHGYIEKGRCVDVHKNDEPEPPVRATGGQ